MSRLTTLIENRDKAKKEAAKYLDKLETVLEERAWTEDEDTKLKDLQKRVKRYNKLIEDAEADERAANEQQETREQKLGHVGVGHEPMTYGPESPDNSFYRDLLAASMPTHPDFDGAQSRLRKHREEFDGILRTGGVSKEARTVRAWFREARRGNPAERRDVSTGSSSMGDLAPPLYFLSETAAYRTYGRTLIDQLAKQPMPETGMTFNIPRITTPTEAVNQTVSGENQSVSTRDMTATYKTGTVQTIVDNLLVSQQYLDRVGPGIEGDQIVRDDQQRQFNRALNAYAWDQLFSGSAGYVAYTDSAFNAYKFKQAVHQAKAAIQKLDGVVAYPTHFITDVDLWESIEGAYDSSNRPFVVPQGVAFNPLAVGDNNSAPEGYSGFHFSGLPAFKDQLAWVQWNGNADATPSADINYHVAVVAALDIAAKWLEGAPVIRVLPQPYANTLTVLIQQFGYCAYVPVYEKAIQLVVGTGTADSLLTA